ncbi:RNaseH domain-containing protein [Streptomyces anulatus]|uniref:RNaseH domain-containing protein n=1 Tax=Streptomyces anulatus TaxID=1892 RepID=UPI003440495A
MERETKAREGGLANSTENAVRDLFRGLGVIDHRLGTAFGKIPLPDYWHIGIHIRRHAKPRQYGQRNTKPAPLTIVLTAIRPVGGVTEPWTAWAYSPITSRWEPYRKTRLAVHSADLGVDVSSFPTIGDESHQVSAAAQITEAALLAARTQLPQAAPMVIYVNGDTSEPTWAGLQDENLEQHPPADLPGPLHGSPATVFPEANAPSQSSAPSRTSNASEGRPAVMSGARMESGSGRRPLKERFVLAGVFGNAVLSWMIAGCWSKWKR